QRSASTAWVQQVAARCHGRASTRLRWAWIQRETRAHVSIGTSRVAGYESTWGPWGSRFLGRNRLCRQGPHVSPATHRHHRSQVQDHTLAAAPGENTSLSGAVAHAEIQAVPAASATGLAGPGPGGPGQPDPVRALALRPPVNDR